MVTYKFYWSAQDSPPEEYDEKYIIVEVGDVSEIQNLL